MDSISQLDNWIVRFHDTPQRRLRLFCFANAGGTMAQFRTWHQVLPDDVDVCPVQLPGQGSRFRETPQTRLQPLVEDLLAVLSPLMDVPYAFWGFSMGAMISFELARQLQRQGKPGPGHMFVSSRPAPHLPPLHPPIHELPDQQFVNAIRQRYNGIPKVVLQERDLLDLLLPVLRVNFEMIETFEFTADGTPLSIPISAFGGLQDPTITSRHIRAWSELTDETFSYFMFPGDHFFMQDHEAAVLQVVARNLMACLQ